MGNRVGLAGYFANSSSGYSGVFTYSYDERGQLSTLADPGYPPQNTVGGVTSFAYDALGRLSWQHNSNGTGSTYAYDAVGSTLQVRHAYLLGNSEIDHAFYGYDAVRKPQWMESISARHTYAYDAVDQLTGEQVGFFGSGGGYLLTTTFDGSGDFTIDASATSANGTWQYGSRASLASSSPYQPYTVPTLQYQGDPDVGGYVTAGTLQPLLVANITQPPTTLNYFGYSFPPSNLILHPGSSGQYSVLRFVAPALGLYHFTGSWQGILNGATTDVHVRRIGKNGTLIPGGSLYSQSVNDNYVPHPFDLADVMLSAGEVVEFLVGYGDNHNHDSDSTGLAVSVTFAPLPTQVTTYTYDAAGRRATQQEQALTPGSSSTAFVTAFTYDAADQLTHTDREGDSKAQKVLTDFAYDANGRRTSTTRTPSNASGIAPTLTTYTWDAASRLAAVELTGGIFHTFTYDAAGMRHGHTAPSGSVDNLFWDPASGAPLLWADPAQLSDSGGGVIIGPPVTIGGGESEGEGGGESPTSPSVAMGTGLGGSATADEDGGGTPISGGTITAFSPLSELFVQTPDAARTLRSLGQSRQSVPIARQFHLDAMGTTEAQTAGAIGAGSDSGTGAGIAEFTFDAFGNGLSTSPLPTPLPLTNADFETPPLGIGTGPGNSANYVYDPTGSGVGWSFTSYGAGIAGNGSNFTYDNPGAPSGTQVAFLQGAGAVQQAVTVPGAGMLSVSFFAAQRGSPTNLDDPNPPPSSQAVRVSLIDSGGNGQTLATVTPAGIAYQQVVTTPVAVSAVGGGTYTLQFLGLDPQGGDNSAFLDRVEATFTATPGAGSDDGTGANPLAWLGGLGYWQGEAGGTGGAGGSGSSDGGVGLSYVRARWLDNETGQWMSVDPVEGEPRYSYARNSPTMLTDASGTQTGPGPDPNPDYDTMYYQYFSDFGDRLQDPHEWTDPPKQFVNAIRSELDVYNANKKAFFQFTEPIVENWAESVNPGVAATFSWIIGGFGSMGVPGLPILNQATLSMMDAWFHGSAGQAQRQHDMQHDTWMKALGPPDSGTAEDFQYRVGFMWGVFEMVLDQIDFLGLASNILEVAVELFKNGDIWSIICEAAKGFFGPLLDAPKAASKKPFIRGKMAGKIVVTLILLVILIKGALSALRRIPAFNMAAERLSVRWQNGVKKVTATSAAVSEIQGRLSSKRMTVEDIENKLKKEPEFKQQVRRIVVNPNFSKIDWTQFAIDAPRDAREIFNKARAWEIANNHDEGSGFVNKNRKKGTYYPSCLADAAAVDLRLKSLGVNEAKVYELMSDQLYGAFTSDIVGGEWRHHYVVRYEEYVIDYTTGYKPKLISEWKKQFSYNPPGRLTWREVQGMDVFLSTVGHGR